MAKEVIWNQWEIGSDKEARQSVVFGSFSKISQKSVVRLGSKSISPVEYLVPDISFLAESLGKFMREIF